MVNFNGFVRFWGASTALMLLAWTLSACASATTTAPSPEPTTGIATATTATAGTAVVTTPTVTTAPATAVATTAATTTDTPVADEAKRAQAQKRFEEGYHIFDVEGGTNHLARAIERYDQAIALDPACAKAYAGKGIALAFRGDLSTGVQLLDKAISLAPDDAFGHYNKGLALKLHRQYPAAEASFQEALRHDPHHPWTYFGLASIYDSWGKEAEALRYLGKAIEILPYCKVTAREKAQEDFAHVQGTPAFQRLIAD
ncbi:tetratricopeptide repeat protein [Heliophilum fasciatum]|uniref:Tetratricopeptide repeat protein n=1 Tax=Heliophilum fasciatum TaxID=35700 RepID=A0A4R2RPL3_9FIRM|nr:tetratricopeptide repeat protein [Heliophilum fasciatum]MCW2278969.1 tetratricopeptide (TPR) repeat protein [Heliophilum fasciatum]TCP61781.1 tetratricopeptide repeat protein [Heliophilum fasciatum]